MTDEISGFPRNYQPSPTVRHVAGPSYNIVPTIHDQFAMAALAGLLSHPKNTASPKEDVELAFKYADQCMKEREK